MSNEKEKLNMNENEDNGGENKQELDDILGQIKETKGEISGSKEKLPQAPEPEKPAESESVRAESEPEGLEEILDKITEKEEEAPEGKLGFLQKITLLFSKPSALFTYLRARPDFWAPILLAVFLSIVTTMFTYDIQMDATINRIENNEKFSDDQKNLILDSIEEGRNGPRRYLSYFVFTPLGIGVMYLVVAGIFLFIGNVVLGGKAGYVQVLSVFAYSFLVLILAGLVLKLPFIIMNHSLDFNTSLSLLLPSSAKGSSIYRLLSAFDVFTLWFLVVFSIGFAIIYRFTQLKGFLAVFITWFIWILIYKVALGSFISAFTG